MCGEQGHISRDCRSPKAAELRATGIIGGSGTGPHGSTIQEKEKAKESTEERVKE